MIVTVTPNPALDLTLTVDALHPGDTHRIPRALERAGGKGLNVARVLAQQGEPVLALMPLDSATGTDFVHDLEASGIPYLAVPVHSRLRRTYALVDEGSTQTSILIEQGDPLDPAEWESFQAAIARSTAQARCLVLSGSLPPAAPTDFHARALAEAHFHGIPAIVDTSGPSLLHAAAAGADLLKPNASELQEATGEPDPVLGCQKLLALGARAVLLSLGEEGMLLLDARDPDSLWRARLPHSLHGNPTGAGDAAVAAAASILASEEHSPELLVRTATAWSAAAVLMPTAGEISPTFPQLAAALSISRTSHRAETP